MLFKNTLELLTNFIKKLPKDQVVAISDDRLCIWQYIVVENFPTSLVSLYEKTAWGLFGVKVYIYSKEYSNFFESGSYFYFPQWSDPDILYRNLINDFSYEIDLKFALPEDLYKSWLSYLDIPLILSPSERTANPDLINDFLYIESRYDFLMEISNHSKYHTFFMTSTDELMVWYLSNQDKLQSMLVLYKYFLNTIQVPVDKYKITKLALISEIQKIRFHVELIKKAMFFGYKNFSQIRSDLNKNISASEVPYQENMGNIEQQEYLTGRVSKIYHRDDIKDFQKWAIMVAYNTNPEYMSAFLSAKAVIVENASRLSHAAITCREFGIPGALWATGCMGFQDNSTIEIDTQSKIIKICQK